MTTPTLSSPDVDLDQLYAQAEDHSLIFLSPRLRDRNVLITRFAQSDENVYFYSLMPQDSTLRAFLSNMAEALRDFDPKFGAQTAQAAGKSGISPQELADALLADLAKAKPKPSFLVLDNFDYLPHLNDVTAFIYRLADKMPGGFRLVINGRELSHQAWAKLVKSGSATVLGDSLTLDGGIYSKDGVSHPHLEVYGFTGGSVFVNGLPLTTWDGPLPRNLFYFFVDHPMITRDEIFEAFWPELPTKEATNVFHVTKRKISERLGYELTAYSGGFYRPSGQMDVHYDVQRFESRVQEGSLTEKPGNPIRMWYDAILLYRSPFLYGLEMPWIQKRREELRMAYVEALVGVARIYKSLKEFERAVSYYLRALREVPSREDIHRDVMSIYDLIGQKQKAMEQYRLLEETLKRTLNITPSKPTRVLFKLITGEH